MKLEFIDDIYKGFSDVEGVPEEELLYFNSYSEVVNNTDPVDLLTKIFSVRYFENFILSFLMYNPSVWKNLKVEDWKVIMEYIERIPLKYPREDSGCYMDIVFLNKYLSVNSLDLFFDNSNISLSSKKDMILSLRLMNTHITNMDQEDKDFFFIDTDFNFNYEDYEQTHQKLINEGMKEGFNDAPEVLSYLKKEWSRITQITEQ